MAEQVAEGTEATMTDEMISALAAEAEAGYDLSRGTVVRVGRPTLKKGSARSPKITYRAPASVYKRARLKAAAEGRAISDVSRGLLKRYVES